MATSKVLRWSGLAAMLGGLFMIVGSVNWEEPPWMWFGSLGSLLLVFGMMGIYAVQIEASGLTGFLGFVALAAGTMLLMGQGNLWGVEFWLLGSLLSAVGLILLGVGTLAAGKFPRWIAPRGRQRPAEKLPRPAAAASGRQSLRELRPRRPLILRLPMTQFQLQRLGRQVLIPRGVEDDIESRASWFIIPPAT